MIDVVVADDEPLGLRGIVARLARREGVRVVAQCANGRETVDAIRFHAPQLLFLDVEMPALDGFDVLQELPEDERPYVIFVTAYERYALRAFDVRALDYLLKPIDNERFNAALDRALETIGDSPARFAIRQKGRTIFVRHNEIDWIEAQGDYVRLHAGSRSWLLRETMAAVERQLGTHRFRRIHRSTIVNVDRIAEVRPFESGDSAVLLRDGTELRLSRNYRSSR